MQILCTFDGGFYNNCANWVNLNLPNLSVDRHDEKAAGWVFWRIFGTQRGPGLSQGQLRIKGFGCCDQIELFVTLVCVTCILHLLFSWLVDAMSDNSSEVKDVLNGQNSSMRKAKQTPQ